jgi:hypothetical protein
LGNTTLIKYSVINQAYLYNQPVYVMTLYTNCHFIHASTTRSPTNRSYNNIATLYVNVLQEVITIACDMGKFVTLKVTSSYLTEGVSILQTLGS